VEEASGLKTVSRAFIALPIVSCWARLKDVATGDMPVAIPTEGEWSVWWEKTGTPPCVKGPIRITASGVLDPSFS